MDAFLEWLRAESEKLRLDAGMLSDRGKVWKEALLLVEKKYLGFKDQEKKSTSKKGN